MDSTPFYPLDGEWDSLESPNQKRLAENRNAAVCPRVVHVNGDFSSRTRVHHLHAKRPVCKETANAGESKSEWTGESERPVGVYRSRAFGRTKRKIKPNKGHAIPSDNIEKGHVTSTKICWFVVSLLARRSSRLKPIKFIEFIDEFWTVHSWTAAVSLDRLYLPW